jgi:asparagine N-glycosylation enzyme membrane subunit Stt3
MKKLKSNFFMFVMFITYIAITLFILKETFPDIKAALILGIVLSFTYSIICFFNKRIRSRATIWWGTLSFLTCILWCYFLFTGKNI